VSQSVSQLVSQSVSQLASQSVNQSVIAYFNSTLLANAHVPLSPDSSTDFNLNSLQLADFRENQCE